jgi:autophagy-related protein 9
VHTEFGTLFAMKITIFFTELLSVLLTPFVLFFSLPPCAGAIIDFFREFTVHVDGVGYVCSFAVFDFRRHGNLKSGESPLSPGSANGHAPSIGVKGKDWRGGANEHKMEKSFLHFKATHPDWQPADPSSSIYLDRLVGMHQASLNDPRPNGHRQTNGSGRQGGYPGSKASGTADGRSRSYDRAWTSPRGRLETMREGDESDDEVIEGGWNRKVKLESREGVGGAADDREDALFEDEGMLGLLQQVMRR